jgi:hypothetical protein
MLFAWDRAITDLEGRKVVDENGAEVTLGHLSIQALMTPPTKDPLTGEDKFRRYRIAERIFRGEDIDVSQAALVKEAVGAVMAPLVVGRVWELLETPKAGAGG